MDKLLLMLVAFSSGVLCNAEQNLTDTANSTLDPMGIMDKTENVYSASADLEPMNQSSIRGNYPYRCCTGDMGVPTYKMHFRQSTWNQARTSCMSEGGQLVIINSNEEGTMLVNWMERCNMNETWIGNQDLFAQGEWVTLTGQTLKEAGYDKWLPGEPNNAGGNEHCGSLVRWNGMNDLPCDRKLYYFCKIYVC